MKIVVGLVTINNQKMLKESIETYWNTTNNPLIIVNNGGEPIEVNHYLGSRNYKIIDLPTQVSLAAAWNKILSIPSDFTVITNDDILYSPGWLDNLIEAMEASDQCGIMQPYNTLGKKPQDFPKNYKLVDEIGPIPVDNFRGCCFGINRIAQEKMQTYEKNFPSEKYKGMFDEDLYPFGSEDQDYYIRMNKAGFDFETCFNSYIHHYTGVTMNQLYSHEEFQKIVDENANKLHEKHARRGDIWKTTTRTS